MRSMGQVIARVSTRGRFSLLDGSPIHTRSAYTMYPACAFEGIYGRPEAAIMVHGLRNNAAGALEKFIIAKRRLKKLGYAYPVVGFTYDSNTLGAHLKKTELRALRAGQRIARHNGKTLAKFLADFCKKSPNTKFRLLGHSLGTEVIVSAIRHLDRIGRHDIVSGVYFFGASVPSDTMHPLRTGSAMQRTVSGKIVNHYSPQDEVLRSASEDGSVSAPLGLEGATGKYVPKYAQKRVRPQNHRFASYAKVLKKFP